MITINSLIKTIYCVSKGEIIMNMKVMNITNLEKFFGVIEQCEEKVELVTENGDKYNLKSKLSQYVSLSKIVFGGVIPAVELITYSPSDSNRIIRYMMSNK